MPRFAAVTGKSGTARIISVEAPTEEEAWTEINRQLRLNPQRLEIWKEWQGSGSRIIEDPNTSAPTTDAAADLDQAADEAGRILQAQLDQAECDKAEETKRELIDMVESAREQIAEAVETLRRVANETDDLYRATHLVAQLETLVGTGGWMALPCETLDGWVKELEDGQDGEG